MDGLSHIPQALMRLLQPITPPTAVCDDIAMEFFTYCLTNFLLARLLSFLLQCSVNSVDSEEVLSRI